jgi:dienelactone hydrolase
VPLGDLVVRGERCDPGTSGMRPGAVILGGCGGYDADGYFTHLIADRLANAGVIALRFDYQGVLPATPFTYCDPADVIPAAEAFLVAVEQGTAWLRADPQVVDDRIGSVGYSLGALLAAESTIGGGFFGPVDNAGLDALAFVSAPVLQDIVDAARAGDLPPLLLLRGDEDLTVAPDNSDRLYEAAIAGGVDARLEAVPGQGHVWLGDAAVDAADLVAAFIADRLHA